MINTKDQEQLFELISNYLEKDILCCAIGGTAMMFYGYKNTTKDIDLIFSSKSDLDIFIKSIKKLGYKRMSTIGIYPTNRQLNTPMMFTRGDERFDLFLNDVFGFKINKEIIQSFELRHDFVKNKSLIIKVLSPEFLILLKSLTQREKDFEDIETILDKKININWDLIIQQAIKQKDNNEWILIDLEETLQKLKSKTFIQSKYFDLIYGAQE